MSKHDPNVHEIIIVKRRGGGHDDGHHGGVWKIAFADFMTAMMAFFLVLWIVNSTSKETRSSIARYFNPIKLADTTPARKGLRDPKDSEFDAAASEHGKTDPAGPTKAPDPPDAKSEKKEDKPADSKHAESKAAESKAAESKHAEKAAKADAKADAKSEGKSEGKGEGKGKAEAGKADSKAGAAAQSAEAAGPTRLRPPADAPAARGGAAQDGREPSLTARLAVHDEGAIAADPQAVLADILAGDPAQSRREAQTSMAAPRSFRDPFEASSPRLTAKPRAGGRAPQDAAGRAREDAAGFGGAEADGPGPEPQEGAEARAAAQSGDSRTGEARSGEARSGEARSGEARSGEARSGDAKSGDAKPGEAKPGQAKPGEARSGELKRGEAPKGAARGAAAKEAVAASPAGAATDKPGESAAADRDLADKAARTRSEIVAAMVELFGPGKGPQFEVTPTPEGLLVSLTDSQAFEMFAIGSSEPHPRAIQLIERLARTLAKTPGPLVVRGHTDARPWRKGVSDNWRLSASRAHMAWQMLLRGGFDGKRLERLEGFADRKPRNPADPLAPENRRIELLIRAKA